MTPMTPAEIVAKMMEKDFFSQWLGIEVMEIRPGYCLLRMRVREEMCNGFSIAHGGISFSLADSALAFAANGHGEQAVSISTAIDHLEKVEPGDILMAEAVELHTSRKLARYRVEIFDEAGAMKAIFRGTVYRTGKTWEQLSIKN